MDLQAFLRADARKELLRLVIVGSVDDGKSTLVGRLLHDCQGLYEDQLDSVRQLTLRRHNVDAEVDYSLFTDGLKAEREQGITIDVAYRYFATHRRKFILADTPGHEQYTRNMATGASTAEAAVILIDARLGVLPQSRRHGYIAHLLGLRHLVVAVNKMDLVGYAQDVFARIRDEYRAFTAGLGRMAPVFIPVSALHGENIVQRSAHMDWYGGPTLLEHLENLPVAAAETGQPLRFPIQGVLRPSLDFRGYMGTVASGRLRAGDEVTALPSMRHSHVRRLVTADGELPEARAGQPVTVVLEDEMDLSRGDLLVAPTDVPVPRRHLEARVVWFDEQPGRPGRRYWIRHTTRTAPGRLSAVRGRLNLRTLAEEPAGELGLNEIGHITLESQQPLFADPYEVNRETGSFILIDRQTHMTAAAGMFLPQNGAEDAAGRPSGAATRRERERLLGQRGAVLWLSGDPQARVEALAETLEGHLVREGHPAFALTAARRRAAFPRQRRAVASLAGLLAEAGLIVLVPDTVPLSAVQTAAPSSAPTGRLLEVRLTDLPGTPAESSAGGTARTPSPAPDLVLEGDAGSPAGLLEPLLRLLRERGTFGVWESGGFEI